MKSFLLTKALRIFFVVKSSRREFVPKKKFLVKFLNGLYQEKYFLLESKNSATRRSLMSFMPSHKRSSHRDHDEQKYLGTRYLRIGVGH